MKTNFFPLALLAVFALTACETQTPDGKIPEDYLPLAKKVVGDYKGKMDSSAAGVLSIRLSGAKVIATFSKPLLGGSCGAIGQLTSVEGSSERLEKATFMLAKNNCVEGNAVYLSISSDLRNISAQVLKNTYSEEVCPSDSQIRSCQDDANKDYAKCEDDACRKQADKYYASCTDCETKTYGNYIGGEFRR